MLAVVIFLFDSLREKRSVLLTEQSGTVCFKNSCSTLAENRCHGALGSPVAAFEDSRTQWAGKHGTRCVQCQGVRN